jgi:hypothetical protein
VCLSLQRYAVDPFVLLAVIDSIMMIISLAFAVVDLYLLVLSSHLVYFSSMCLQESKARAQHNAIVPGAV